LNIELMKPKLSPREQASLLVNDYATKSAALEAATADTRAQITALTAALNQAAAPHIKMLEDIEAAAKALALEHGEEIFGDKRSLTENGFCLALRESAAVQVEDEDSAIRMLRKDAVAGYGSAVEMACHACLRTTTVLDRDYITRHYDESPHWFQQYGITIVDKLSASLKAAPKPRTKKATQLKTAQVPVEQEAAA
jgi:hypothetical protein